MEVVQVRAGKIPERVITLDRLVGMESAKRALKVALAGAHPIVFLYNSNACAIELVRAGRRLAVEHELAFHGLVYPACPCGNYGSKTRSCRCKHGAIRRHLAKLSQRQDKFDLWVDACRTAPASSQEQAGEREAAMIKRILTMCRSVEVLGMPDPESRELLKTWQTHVGRAVDEDRILRVARTIAWLEGTGKTLRAYQVAEAIQYQAQALSWLDDCLKPQIVELEISNSEERG